MRHADRAEPQIGVAQHHALGPAGRAGGVEQGGKLVRIAGRRRQGLIPVLPVLQRDSVGIGRDRPAPGFPAAPRLAISSLAPLSARMCAAWACFSTGLIGTWTSAGARRGERHDAGEHGLAHPARHPVAGMRGHGPAAQRPVRPTASSSCRIGQPLLADDERGRIAHPATRQMIERIWRRVGRSHPPRLASPVAPRKACLLLASIRIS